MPQAALNLPPVDIDRVMDAEARAMHEAADGRRLIGKGVTPEAQDLFDALYKTCVHPYFVQLRLVGHKALP